MLHITDHLPKLGYFREILALRRKGETKFKISSFFSRFLNALTYKH